MDWPKVLFEDAAKITQISSHEYKANVHPDYSYGPAAHGGFTVALIWRAIAVHYRTTLAKYDLPDTIAFHVEFLRPAMLGDVSVQIKDVRLGKASSTVHAALLQKGTERVVVYATNVNRGKSRKSMTKATDYRMSPPAPAMDFAKLEAGNDNNWILYQVHYKADAGNRALSNIITTVPRNPNPDRSIREQWVTHAIPGQLWKTDQLGWVVDSAVPPMENYFPDSPHSALANAEKANIWAREGPPKEHPEWSAPRYYPTLNLSLDVKKALPEEGVKWLFTRFRTKDVREGRFDVLCEVWDEQGEMVALSQQLWLAFEIDLAAARKARRGPGPSGKL